MSGLGDAETFRMRITRTITEEGQGVVIYTFSPSFLNRILAAADVASAEDLQEQQLRILCEGASTDAQERMMGVVEEEVPGTTVMAVEDDNGLAEFHTADLGYDLVRRIATPDHEDFDTMCNPLYNTVRFELRLFDDTVPKDENGNDVGRTVLQAVLEPPSLA